jgi:hypothetical protein
MPDPAIEGKRIYKLLYNDYNNNFGAAVVGISGSQGSVKTTVCLDLVEKKIEHHPEETLFWRETLKSPMQCERLLHNKFYTYIQEGNPVRFKKASSDEPVDLDIISFKNVRDLYDIVKPGRLNVIFFNSNKQWTELIELGNINPGGMRWKSIFLDEMEGLYQAGANNQTEERWWDFMQYTGEAVKECRKGHTSLFGNYHDGNLIDHRVRGKFMFFLYGYGSVANASQSRVNQGFIDGCKMGEFCIAHGRGRFGKIQIETFYKSIDDPIIPYI